MYNTIEIKDILEDLINLLKPVIMTLGPNGKKVFIEKFSTTLTKDGITILNNLKSSNKFTMVLIKFIQDNINNMNQLMGDGTTSTVILLMELLKITMDHMNNPYLTKTLTIFQQIIIDTINQFNKKLTLEDEDLMISIGTIAANNDEVIGKILKDIMIKIGSKGLIHIEKVHQSFDGIQYEIQRGFQIQYGVINHTFLMENGEFYNEKIIENPKIFISNGSLSIMNDYLENFFNDIIKDKNPLVIIAPDIGGLVLNNIIKLRNYGIEISVIKLPNENLLEDIGVVAHGTLWNNMINKNPRECLGHLPWIKIGLYKTEIPLTHNNLINNHINNLKKHYQEINDNHFQTSSLKNNLSQRIANLSNKIAVIKIGGINEAEKDEIQDRIMDAIGSLKIALDHGISIGGGMTGFFAYTYIKNNINKLELVGEIKKLLLIFNEAILGVLKNIIVNSNEDFSTISNELLMYYDDISWHQLANIIENNKELLLWNGFTREFQNHYKNIVNSSLVEKTIINTSFNLLFNIINSSYIVINDI